MAVIQAAHTIMIIDLAALAPLLNIAVRDLMGSKNIYGVTQVLAEVLSHYADDMEYLSRHIGNPCLSLWADTIDDNGMLENNSVTPLSQHSHNGKSTQQILKSQQGIYYIVWLVPKLSVRILK